MTRANQKIILDDSIDMEPVIATCSKFAVTDFQKMFSCYFTHFMRPVLNPVGFQKMFELIIHHLMEKRDHRVFTSEEVVQMRILIRWSFEGVEKFDPLQIVDIR